MYKAIEKTKAAVAGLSIPAERLLFGTHSELQAPHQPSAQIGCLHPPATPPAPQTPASVHLPGSVVMLRALACTQALLCSSTQTLLLLRSSKLGKTTGHTQRLAGTHHVVNSGALDARHSRALRTAAGICQLA